MELQSLPTLKRPRYNLHVPNSPPGAPVASKVRANFDVEDGPYGNWRLYNSFNEITQNEDTWPIENVVLQDWHVYHLLENCPAVTRKTRWPADFDSGGHIRSSRNPRGRAAKKAADDVWYYLVYRQSYQLHGDEGAEVLEHPFSNSQSQSKKSVKWTKGERCRIQSDFCPDMNELLNGTSLERFTAAELARSKIKQDPQLQPGDKKKKKEKKEKQGTGAKQSNLPRTTSGATKLAAMDIEAPRKVAGLADHSALSTSTTTFNNTFEPIKMVSRSLGRTAMQEAYTLSQAFHSKEIAFLLYETNQIRDYAMAALQNLDTNIRAAANEPEEDVANETLTHTVRFSRATAEAIENRCRSISQNVIGRIGLAGLSKNQIEEEMTRMKRQGSKPQYRESVDGPLEFPSMSTPEHNWDIKRKLASVKPLESKKSILKPKRALVEASSGPSPAKMVDTGRGKITKSIFGPKSRESTHFQSNKTLTQTPKNQVVAEITPHTDVGEPLDKSAYKPLGSATDDYGSLALMNEDTSSDKGEEIKDEEMKSGECVQQTKSEAELNLGEKEASAEVQPERRGMFLTPDEDIESREEWDTSTNQKGDEKVETRETSTDGSQESEDFSE